ncbi:CRC domain-containing protein TSO1-like isoform X2 [Prunus avium]|uniref:CRC domain-containing protein TSO1-like isoform X2 n=1 Tax=Prunus avium TaxID=42229 RepID=A0A6P5TNX0_PRUAV|nr:CRC domain-containing protein TSO1-like isoform X2 [Prunus avium]
MDSPEIRKIKANTTSSSDSPPVQDSPVFSYINNLSPIQPVKASHLAQGFPVLNSPPLVFTSPRINSHRDTSFLKRPQYQPLSSAEKPKTQDEAKKFLDDPVDPKITQLHMRLITDSQDRETKIRVESQQCSSSEGVDEYLADPSEVDCVDSTQSASPCLKQSNNVPETFTGSKETTLYDKKHNTGTDLGTEAKAPSEQAKEDLEGKQTFDAKPVKIIEQSDGDLPYDECPNIESGLSIDNAYKREYRQHLHDQDRGGKHQDDCDHTPQSPPGRLQIVQVYENSAENVGAISKGMIGNMILHAPKARSEQGGMHRRCLQFEEAPPCATGERDCSLSSIQEVNNSELPSGTGESKLVKLSYADLKATSKRQMGTSLPPRYGGNSPSTVPKPSGIGLHLNSIVNAAPLVRGTTRSIKLADHYIGVQVMKSASVMSSHLPDNVRSRSISLNMVEKDSAGPEDRDESETSITASSAVPQSPHTVVFEHHGPTHEKRGFDAENVDDYEECKQSSPKKKRKKTSSTKDSDGTKRCNCKKTKCLKLYCDCFAAGVYCAESCACQGCFNITDYEDTVLETRQHIESRNPLAFAPKIVQHEEEIQFTPSSARHKRGCNCKKSMCLKKYCECYQANVGCSSGCRCDGCKNVYGRKGEYIPIEHGVGKDNVSDKAGKDRIESTFDEKLEMVATKKDILSAELYNSHNLTPLAPSFQCSDHANNVPKSPCLPTSYLPSPESDLTIISSYENSTRSPLRHSESSDILLETSKELSDLGSYNWRVDYDNIGIVDTFSPRCDAAPTTCHITPMSDLCSMAMASSTSSKTSDWTNASQVQLCPGSHGLSSDSSLHRRSSPVTPMTRLGGTKSFQGLDFENGLYDILQDDTPEILKDTSTPIRSLKVSSPNKKRVSPPHSHNHELGASSSGALRSGRKFILKAVPSFPPLTPCIGSKGGSIIQNMSNLQDKGRKK